MQTTRSVDSSLGTGFTRRRLFQGLAGLTGVAAVLRAEPAFKLTDINHVFVNVADLKRSEEFYTKLFGPPAEKSSSGLVNFRVGSADIGMGVVRERHVGADHLCLSVEGYGVGPTSAKLKQNGINPEWIGAAGQIYFRDPDRILIQLEHPAYRNPEFERVTTSQAGPKPLFNPLTLDHVTLQISNLEKATAFYEGLFGPAVRGTKNNASLFTGTGQDLTWTTSGPGSNPIGIDHFCIAIEGYEPDAVTEKLRQVGIASQRLNEPDQVYFRDPDGILVQLAQDSRARRQSSGRK